MPPSERAKSNVFLSLRKERGAPHAESSPPYASCWRVRRPIAQPIPNGVSADRARGGGPLRPAAQSRAMTATAGRAMTAAVSCAMTATAGRGMTAAVSCGMTAAVSRGMICSAP